MRIGVPCLHVRQKHNYLRTTDIFKATFLSCDLCKSNFRAWGACEIRFITYSHIPARPAHRGRWKLQRTIGLENIE